jgi:hypothetical protein
MEEIAPLGQDSPKMLFARPVCCNDFSGDHLRFDLTALSVLEDSRHRQNPVKASTPADAAKKTMPNQFTWPESLEPPYDPGVY